MAASGQGTVRPRAEQDHSESSADEGYLAVRLADMPMAPLAQDRPLQSTRVPRKKVKMTRSAGEQRGNLDDASALWHVVQRALPLEENSSATCAIPVADAVFTAASGSYDAELPSAREVVAPVVQRLASLHTIVHVLEGQPVRVEEHGVEGTSGHYRRFLVTCPLHTLPGALPCRVRRNTGRRQTSKLGLNEPLAYLGAWLAAGSGCASRDEHMTLKPSDADTRVYAQRCGLA